MAATISWLTQASLQSLKFVPFEASKANCSCPLPLAIQKSPFWGRALPEQTSTPSHVKWPHPGGTRCQATTTKEGVRAPRQENVPGEFYVDHTCIDCDTCRWMAPEVFSRKGNMSAVHHQPENEEQRMKSLQALLACPTASIHTASPPADIGKAHATFPLPIDPNTLPGVYHCGYHSKRSYGATSYFIQRHEGNILVDSPRYTEQLAKRLEQLGGVQYMFLTHRDDVADHDRWRARFNCVRILHEDEVNYDTADVEMRLEGTGPWNLGTDVELIFTPGHTEGCVSLLWKPGMALFSGDHLAHSWHNEGLSIFRHFNWHSVSKQVDSVRKLIEVDFVWLLPGHGRRYHFLSLEEKKEMLGKLVEQEGGEGAWRR